MLARHQRVLTRLSNLALHSRCGSQLRAVGAQHAAVWQDCRRLARHFNTSQRSVSANLIAKKDSGRNIAWTQDDGSLCIGVEVGQDVKGKEVNLEVHPTRMKLDVQQKPVLEGSFPAAVVPDGCFFAMETAPDNSRLCVITIEKRQVGGERWLELFEEEKLDTSITDRARFHLNCVEGGPAAPTNGARAWQHADGSPFRERMRGKQKAFLDISIGEEAGDAAEPQRVELGLYGVECPKTVRNFLALCSGSEGAGESGQPLHYKGSKFHRIIKNFMVQGGDITKGDGTGGESIYGGKFEDESTRVKHDKPMKLCMANAGPDTNGSQFYITFVPCSHLDGNHVVFGEVLSGQEVVKQIEEEAGSEDGTPVKPVMISDCGVLEAGSDSAAAAEPVAEAAAA